MSSTVFTANIATVNIGEPMTSLTHQHDQLSSQEMLRHPATEISAMLNFFKCPGFKKAGQRRIKFIRTSMAGPLA